MNDTTRQSVLQLAALGLITFSLAGCGSDEASVPLAQTSSSAPANSTTTALANTSSSTTSTTEEPAITTSTAPPPNTKPCLPGAEPVEGAEYRVFNVKDDDVLNIRELPGHKTAKVGALGPNTSGLRPTGACRVVGTGAWWELDTSGTGAWVNSKFLTTG